MECLGEAGAEGVDYFESFGVRGEDFFGADPNDGTYGYNCLYGVIPYLRCKSIDVCAHSPL